MIHVVLGMHKSGTTLVSQMLHVSGIHMVEAADPDVGYDDGNQWERESTKAVNHAILGSAGAYSLRASRPAGATAGPHERERMREIVCACEARHTDWGFKDPRTCLTYGEWAEELPAHRIIAVYRTAEEAWAHYWRNASGARRLTVLHEFLPRWCEYNAAILAALARTTMPAIVIPYTTLMQEAAAFSRLERFVGRPLVDVREPRMQRSRPGRSDAYRAALRWHRLRGGPDPAGIEADLDAAAGVPGAPLHEADVLGRRGRPSLHRHRSSRGPATHAPCQSRRRRKIMPGRRPRRRR